MTDGTAGKRDKRNETAALVSVESVTKEYALGRTTVPALRGVSFTIRRGEFLCIVGPSGCGKSTLLNLIGCIDEPTAGVVRLGGADLASLSDDRKSELRLRSIGFIFQSFNLVPVLSIAENVELPMILAGIGKRERRRRVDELVELTRLSDFVKHRPDELSGGQRQRVAIARALANRPEIVIADEPTANLDSETGEAVVDAMRELNEAERTTFVFSTHNPEIMRHAKRIVRLRNGLIVAEENGAAAGAALSGSASRTAGTNRGEPADDGEASSGHGEPSAAGTDGGEGGLRGSGT